MQGRGKQSTVSVHHGYVKCIHLALLRVSTMSCQPIHQSVILGALAIRDVTRMARAQTTMVAVGSGRGIKTRIIKDR